MRRPISHIVLAMTAGGIAAAILAQDRREDDKKETTASATVYVLRSTPPAAVKEIKTFLEKKGARGFEFVVVDWMGNGDGSDFLDFAKKNLKSYGERELEKYEDSTSARFAGPEDIAFLKTLEWSTLPMATFKGEVFQWK